MRKKKKYCIVINSYINGNNNYKYAFGKINNICVSVSKTGLKVEFESFTNYTLDDLIKHEKPLFDDMFKKCYLLYLMHNNDSILIKNIKLAINEKFIAEKIFKIKEIFMFSMYEKAERKITKKIINKTIVENILSQTKSKYDSRMASLFSYIVSKTKKYETERFIYLWMSFNGFYYYLFNYPKYKGNNDRDALSYFRKIYNMGAYIDYDKKKRIGDEIYLHRCCESILRAEVKIDFNSNKSIILGDKVINKISGVIKNVPSKCDYKATPLGYLLTVFAYEYRCKYLHGNFPVDLFAYTNEISLHSLRIINDLIEKFLDDYLWEVFDVEYLKRERLNCK